MSDPVRKLLQRSLETGEFVAIHKWADDPTIFIVGQVMSLGKVDFSISNIELNGQPENEENTFDLTNICGIELGTPYLLSLVRLAKLSPAIELSKGRTVKGFEAIRNELAAALNSRRVVRAFFDSQDREVEQKDLVPLEFAGDWMRYAVVFDNGELESGESWLDIRLIARLQIDSTKERTSTALIT